MKLKLSALICTIGCLLQYGCTPEPVVRGNGASEAHCPPVSEHHGDTLGYTISFSDKAQQADFVESFRSFLNQYPFSELRSDTAAGQIVVRLAPPGAPSDGRTLSQPIMLAGTDASLRIDAGQVIQPGLPGSDQPFGTTQPFAYTVEPVTGGTLRCYSPRGGIDEPFLPLVTVDPFTGIDSIQPVYLSVVGSSPKKLSLQITGRVIDGGGRLVSALDIIEAWTAFVKKHPAEGFALFRHVEGIREFIAGKEAVVRGFGATDQKTVYMKFSQADTLSALRIQNSRICAGGYLKLGRYNADKSADGGVLLTPNTKSGTRHAYCDTLKIISVEDRNPILSFSLKKYDALPLSSLADLSYARTTLEKQAALWPFSRDRYFLSCTVDDEKVRAFLSSRINPGELLKNVVKTEGTPLTAIETDEPAEVASMPVSTEKPTIPSVRTVRILFRKDDPVSCAVAEKLLADLSGSIVRGVLAPSGISEYERALVDRNYDCAVGWVTDNVRTDPAERLRMASIWFADANSEHERITSRREIPLFSVNRYLLMRRPAGLYRNAIDGMYTSSRPVAGR